MPLVFKIKRTVFENNDKSVYFTFKIAITVSDSRHFTALISIISEWMFLK